MKRKKIKQMLSKVILVSMLLTQSQIINAVSIKDSNFKNINESININYENDIKRKDNEKISNSSYEENIVDIDKEIVDEDNINTETFQDIDYSDNSEEIANINQVNKELEETDKNINNTNKTDNNEENKYDSNKLDELDKKEDIEDLKSKALESLENNKSNDTKDSEENIVVITSFEELKEAILNEEIKKIIIGENANNIDITQEIIIDRDLTIDCQGQIIILSEVNGKNIAIDQDAHLILENAIIENNTFLNYKEKKLYGGIENNGCLEMKNITLTHGLKNKSNNYKSYDSDFEDNLDNIYDYLIKDGIIVNNNILTVDKLLVDSCDYNEILGIIYNKENAVAKIDKSNFLNFNSEQGIITNEGEIEIRNSTFLNNESRAISLILNLKNGYVKIENTLIEDNYQDYGYYIINLGKIDIKNSKFSNNTIYSGALILNNNNLNILNTTFIDNNLEDYVCIINTKRGSMEILDSQFSGNIGTIGGAIYNKNKLRVENSSFEKNISLGGGAIVNENKLDLYNTSFLNNEALLYGGAIINTKEDMHGSIDKAIINMYGNNEFSYNNAQSGGAIAGINLDTSINIKENANVIFKGNKALEIEDNLPQMDMLDKKEGGAIYNSSLIVEDNSKISFIENMAELGGAIFNDSKSVIDITSSRGALFENNQIASKKNLDGIDIAISINDYLNINNSSFINNNNIDKSSIYIHNLNNKANNKNLQEFLDGKNLKSVFIKDSYFNNKGSVIGIDDYLLDSLSISNVDKNIYLNNNLFENIKNIIYYNEPFIDGYPTALRYEEPNILNKLRVNIENSTFDVKNISLIDEKDGNSLKNDSYLLTEFNFINNTFLNLDNLNLNSVDMKLKHNTIISEDIKVEGLVLLENNLILSLQNKDFSNILGENFKIKDSEDKILYKNKVNLKDDLLKKLNIMQSINDNLSLSLSLSNESLNLSKDIIKRIEDYYVFLVFDKYERDLLIDFDVLLIGQENENLEHLKKLEKLDSSQIWEILEEELRVNNIGNRELYRINEDIKKLNSNTLDTSNIFINLQDEKDIIKTINKEYSSFNKVGSDKNKVLKHYNPVKNSLASGFTRLKKISVDANNKKREIITMGSIEEDINTNEKPEPGITEDGNKNNNINNQSSSSTNYEIFEIVLDANGGVFDNNKKTIQIKNKENIKFPKRKGYKLLGWTKDLNKNHIITNEKLEEEIKNLNKNKISKKYYAVWEKEITKLNYTDHIAYILGYEDQTFRPNENVTREEVAQIIFNILSDEYKKDIYSNKNNFKDISTTRWSNEAISTLVNADILKGYKDGSFKYKSFITRAEVASILSKLLDENVGYNNMDKKISDISSHWAEEDILKCIDKNIIKGYSDHTFRPDDYITRAEFVTMVNRLLNRGVKKENILENIKIFKDININSWYYEELIEASNSHIFSREDWQDRIDEKWLDIK